MNILFIYDSPLIEQKGGTERATSLVMKELERRGHKCTGFLHFNQNNPNEYFLNGNRINSLTEFLEINNIDIVVNQIAFHSWLLKEFLLHGGNEWRKKGGKIISFMHFDPSPDTPMKIVDLLRYFSKRSLISKLKRLILLLYLPILRTKISLITKESYKYIYNESDAYVVMSANYIKSFKQIAHLSKTDKISVITNMLTFDRVANPNTLREKENIILVVSRLDEKQKRISIILDIWKRANIKDWKLQIIGTGKDEDYYHDIVRNNNIKNVVFLGHQSPLPFYQKAKIFLMTSPKEGWGLTITESMQNGVVPVVLNTSSVFKDIIIDGKTGFLAKDKKQMINIINSLTSNNNLLLEIARNALSDISRFSSERVGNDWQKLINSLYS